MVIAPFNVSDLPPKLTIPFVWTNGPETTTLLPNVNVCAARFSVIELNVVVEVVCNEFVRTPVPSIPNEDVEEPVNTPLLAATGKVIAPFKVKEDVPRVKVPFVCVKALVTFKSVAKLTLPDAVRFNMN